MRRPSQLWRDRAQPQLPCANLASFGCGRQRAEAERAVREERVATAATRAQRREQRSARLEMPCHIQAPSRVGRMAQAVATGQRCLLGRMCNSPRSGGVLRQCLGVGPAGRCILAIHRPCFEANLADVYYFLGSRLGQDGVLCRSCGQQLQAGTDGWGIAEASEEGS